MDFARLRILALLLLSIAAGAFGYSYGWERGQIAATAQSDQRFTIMQERLSQLETANAASEAPLPLASSARANSAS